MFNVEMKNFFLNLNGALSDNLSILIYFSSLLITYICFVLILVYKDKISDEKCNKIRIISGFIILINWILRRGSFIYYGVYSYTNNLDLGFCSLTSILFLIYCFTNSKKLFNIVYYMSYSSLLIAIIFPSIIHNPLGYAFYSFIIIHHFCFLMIIFFALKNKIKYDRKTFLKCAFTIISIYFAIEIFNLFVGTQYNSLKYLINKSFEKIGFLTIISNNWFLSSIFLIGIGIFMCYIGILFLKKMNKD